MLVKKSGKMPIVGYLFKNVFSNKKEKNIYSRSKKKHPNKTRSPEATSFQIRATYLRFIGNYIFLKSVPVLS